MARKLTVWWDREGDFLEITMGKSRKGFFKDVGNDILLRVDARTGKPIGFAIINFSKNFKNLKKPKGIELPVKIELKRA